MYAPGGACICTRWQVVVALPFLHRLESQCCHQTSSLHSNTHCAPLAVKSSPGVVWLALIRSLRKWDFHFPVTFWWTQREPPGHRQSTHSASVPMFTGHFMQLLFLLASVLQEHVHHTWLQLQICPRLPDVPVILPLPWDPIPAPTTVL